MPNLSEEINMENMEDIVTVFKHHPFSFQILYILWLGAVSGISLTKPL